MAQDDVSQPIALERHGHVLTIVLNRPHVRNALDMALARGLAGAIVELDDDDDIRVGILAGAGGTFCSGMDLRAFAAGETPVSDFRDFDGLVATPPRKPLIAAVEGYAVAGGLELVLACDGVVAARDAQFGIPEVRRGLVAAGGAVIRLPRRIPYMVAMELALTGDLVGAERAAELGLVNRLTAPGEARAEALRLAERIAANAPLAVAAAKQLIRRSGDWTESESWEKQLEVARASDAVRRRSRGGDRVRREARSRLDGAVTGRQGSTDVAVLSSSLDVESEPARHNREAMTAKLEQLEALLAEARAGGGERYVERHRKRGKRLVRERIELLLDRDAPFVELQPLIACESDYHTGGSVACGIGVVESVECIIVGNDPTVRGGANNPFGLRKILRALEIARQNRLPLINLTESAGADLPAQAELFIPGGAIFRALTRLSAAAIPTITLVFGSSTAGGAYVPGMSDYTVFVEGGATVYLGGPPLVKMATGEDAGSEELGGATMHSTVSGLSDYLAPDEVGAIRIGREIVASLNWRKHGPGPSRPPDPPLHDGEDLLSLALGRPAHPVRPARDPRARPRRLALLRVQAALRQRVDDRLGLDPRLSGRSARQRPRGAVLGGGAEGDAVHPARQSDRRAAGLHPQRHRLHGRQGLRERRDHQARRADDQRRRQLRRTAHRADGRRVLWRRELRDVRPGIRAALPVRVAERPVRGHGPVSARGRAVARRARRQRGARRGVRRGR